MCIENFFQQFLCEVIRSKEEMPVVRHEPDFAELVDRAAERRNRSTEQWNNAISDLYGATIDPITRAYKKMMGKVSPDVTNPSFPSTPANLIIPPTKSTLKNSSLAYMLIIGPLMYPRLLVICFAILTLLFRLSDPSTRQKTAELSDTLDITVNAYFLFEGVLRLFTIPAVFEIRRRHFEGNIPPANSLTYEILRCGWIEIVISLLSLAISSLYDYTNPICWFNLLRLSFIANFFVLELPQIEVLLSGIYTGLRSIISTWFLLMITFIVYGVLATACFRENDPAHFSTVGTSMFTLFRVSTMDNWSQVNYINAYGCDAVDSDYKVISRNSTEPRYVDVFSGRMYLFLCDSPNSHPYLSSFIFTSFVVFTGFILISLTVAAVSDGVHQRLEEIQKQQTDEDEYEFDDELLDETLETTLPGGVVSQKRKDELINTMRNFAFNTKLKQKLANQSSNTVQISSEKRSSLLLGSTCEDESKIVEAQDMNMNIGRMDSLVEEQEEEEELDLEKMLRENQRIVRDTSQTTETSNDVKETQEPSGGGEDASCQEAEIRSPDVVPVACKSSESLPSHPSEAPIVKSTSAMRKTLKVKSLRRSGINLKLPLIEDKELILLMLRQLWKDVEIEKAKRSEEGDVNGVDVGATPEENNSSSNKQLSHPSSITDHLSGMMSPQGSLKTLSTPHTPFGSSTQRRRSFSSQEGDVYNSRKRIAYFFRNALCTYSYIGYIILIVLVTASFQIYCTNKDNCVNFQGVFIAVQILLSLDIIVRILTYYPSYKTFFFSRHNLFDLGMVLIIWIPVFTKHGNQIGQIAESARIVYLLRLLPLLSWITDLQIIMLSVASSIRPLLYVVGMMFLMFFHFAVAGVLIFKQNDEFYFGTLFRAMMSLSQVCTLDNWGDIALKNMYGCDYYGSDTGVDLFDELCETSHGLGWIAAWYFLVFISLSVMILQSLFVGIIISATELLKDGVTQEAEMWKIIALRMQKYGLQNSTLMNLLDIFNALDTQLNGLLTEQELEPLLKFLPPISNVTSLISQVGPKVKGNLNFAEFIDFVHYLGLRTQAYKPGFRSTKVAPGVALSRPK